MQSVLQYAPEKRFLQDSSKLLFNAPVMALSDVHDCVGTYGDFHICNLRLTETGHVKLGYLSPTKRIGVHASVMMAAMAVSIRNSMIGSTSLSTNTAAMSNNTLSNDTLQN